LLCSDSFDIQVVSRWILRTYASRPPAVRKSLNIKHLRKTL
jgi:hypothetical protein